jgi:hypothetical protein
MQNSVNYKKEIPFAIFFITGISSIFLLLDVFIADKTLTESITNYLWPTFPALTLGVLLNILVVQPYRNSKNRNRKL